METLSQEFAGKFAPLACFFLLTYRNRQTHLSTNHCEETQSPLSSSFWNAELKGPRPIPPFSFSFLYRTRPGDKDTFSVTYNPETKRHLSFQGYYLHFIDGETDAQKLGKLSIHMTNKETKSSFLMVNLWLLPLFFFSSLDCS